MQALRYLGQLAGKIRRAPTRNRRAYARKVCFPEITMDDLPNPSGNWNACNNALQSKNNVHLIVGIIFFAATLGVGIGTQQFSVPGMPDEPMEIECYCDFGKCSHGS